MTDLSRRDFFGRAAAASGAVAVAALPAAAMARVPRSGGVLGTSALQTLTMDVGGLEEIEASFGRLERIGLPLLRAGAGPYPDPNLDADIDCLRSVSRVVKYRMQHERDRQREL